MLLKKSALIGVALGFLALPVIASASLDTYNWTDQSSTVKITSNALKPCSSTFSKVTPPMNHTTGAPGFLSTTQLEVKTICGQFSGICTADVYASANCTGTKVATLTIDVASLAVKLDTSKPQDPHYKITSAGSRVDIKPVA
jgi:hypothetical protein